MSDGEQGRIMSNGEQGRIMSDGERGKSPISILDNVQNDDYRTSFEKISDFVNTVDGALDNMIKKHFIKIICHCVACVYKSQNTSMSATQCMDINIKDLHKAVPETKLYHFIDIMAFVVLIKSLKTHNNNGGSINIDKINTKLDEAIVKFKSC